MLSPTLPDSARLWIFTADRTLTAEDRDRLLDGLNRFVAQWASHGRPVLGDVTIVENRFVVVGAQLDGGVSGCGIDSLTHAVEEAGAKRGIRWVDGLNVVFRDAEGTIQVLPRPAFRQLARDGAVTTTTTVFDTTVQTVGDLREHGLERPAGSTWHGPVFRLMEPA